MKVIYGPVPLERIGHWGRIMEYEYPEPATGVWSALANLLGKKKMKVEWEAECCPMGQGETRPNEMDEWGVFGGTVGYGTASFKTREDAIEFISDIPHLDDKAMKEKWEKKTGPLPLWDEVV